MVKIFNMAIQSGIREHISVDRMGQAPCVKWWRQMGQYSGTTQKRGWLMPSLVREVQGDGLC